MENKEEIDSPPPSSGQSPNNNGGMYLNPFLGGLMGGPPQFGYHHPSFGNPGPQPPFGMPVGAPSFYPYFIPAPSMPMYPPPPSHMTFPPPSSETHSKPADLKAIEDYIHSLLSKPNEEKSEETKEENNADTVDDKINQIFFEYEKLNLNQPPLPQQPPVPQQPQQEELKIQLSMEEGENKNPSDVGISNEGNTENLPPAASQPAKKPRNRVPKKIAALELPKSLDRLTDSVTAVFNNLRPNANDFTKRMKLLEKLQQIVENTWPDANPHLNLFGSSANEFGFKNADMDLCLQIGEQAGTPAQIVQKLGFVLTKKGMNHIQRLPKARVPIVKFQDPATKFSCDICFNNELALNNTRLVAAYAKIDIRFKQLGFIVKHWAKQRQINEPYAGTLSSYAYLMMVINFLQQRKPPVLPCLQQIRDPGDEDLHVFVDGHDCYFFDQVDRLKDFGMANTETTGELLANFFKLYALQFDWDHAVVSPRTGGYLTKTEKSWNKVYDERTRDYFLFTLEDPFETTHNLGRVVDRENLKIIKEEFRRAYRLVCNNEDLKLICKKYTENEPQL